MVQCAILLFFSPVLAPMNYRRLRPIVRSAAHGLRQLVTDATDGQKTRFIYIFFV